MEVSKIQWKSKSGWNSSQLQNCINHANLVLCFGGRSIIEKTEIFNELKAANPDAEFVYSSTAGEIFDIDVHDDSISVILMKFEYTPLKTIKKNIKDYSSCKELGESIITELNAPDLNHVFLVSDGQLVNGSDLLSGIQSLKNEQTIVTGGLAGDGYNFKKTTVGLNDKPEEGNVVAIGYYGDRLKVGFGSGAGWDTMTKSRSITSSNKNVLYELDGQSALGLYKNYLGAAASSLPGSALYYPLSICDGTGSQRPVIRTILSINEEEQSMTFAGNIPKGYSAKMMKRNPERLIKGAGSAAAIALDTSKCEAVDLAIVVSCVGRKIVLGQNVDEEVEEVKKVLGNETEILGFYSYGEVGPKGDKNRCELYNQSITITTYKEI